jgi:peptidyl-prolyl cis-trans isomerase D
MLDFMRRNARSWGIKAALGVICLVFVFFMGGGGQLGRSPQSLVQVGDIEITRAEYEMAQRRNENYFRQQFQGQMSDQMMKALNIPRMTLDQLVDGAVLRAEAGRLGLSVPEEAIRTQLMRVPAFQSNGAFSPTLYRETLRAQGLTPGAFEESVRQDLLEAQIADIIRRGTHVSEEEAWQDWRLSNRRMSLSYLVIDAAPLEKDVAVTDEALAKFYEGKREDYRRPANVKVRYLAYKVEDLAPKVEVSDVDLNEYYEINKNVEFHQDEQVAARHILKKADKEAGEDAKKAARAAVEAIAKRIADGASFEELAKAESEDQGSADKGGDLGYFGRGRMVPAFEAAAFALETGKVSEVVESDFGYHLIQTYDRKPAGVLPFEEVKDKIRATLAMEKAVDRAFDESAEDAAKIADGATLDSVASARGMTVAETPLFAEGDVVPGIGQAPALQAAAFALSGPGSASQPVKVNNDWYVLALAERKDSYVPELAEVRDRVEAAFRAEQALEAARKRADELLASLQSGTSLDELAERENLDVKKLDDVGGKANVVPDFGSVQALTDVAFATTKDGEPLGRSFVSSGKAAIFVRDGVTETTKDAFLEKKDEQIEKLAKAREQAALREFIRSLKEKEKISYDLASLRPVLGDSAPVEE